MNQKSTFARRGSNRKGAAVVEFAVCLPVILLIVLGSIEGASMLFLRQTLVQASYEGAKVAIRTGDKSLAETAVNQVANGRRVQGLRFDTTPTDLASAQPGDVVTITVSAPGDSNSLFPFGPFKNRIVSAEARMIRE